MNAIPRPTHILIAVDIGNSRLKLGRFERRAPTGELLIPTVTIELPLTNRAGDFDHERFATWCRANAVGRATWVMSSVHRGATERLKAAATELAAESSLTWTIRQLALADVPLVVEVDAPERVGMDRLMGAVAADRLRPADRAAIVVDLGTATKLSVLSETGAFVGGAIMPGLAMSARALEEQTDALPYVDVARWQTPPTPVGRSTVPAIEAGLFWGTVGAIRELVAQYKREFAEPPTVIITGGSSELVAQVLSERGEFELRHEPHLVLSGVAIVDSVESQR